MEVEENLIGAGEPGWEWKSEKDVGRGMGRERL